MARAEDEYRLPIKLGPVSNGEYDPEPLSRRVQEAVTRAHAMAEQNARRLGISRRRFLASLCGSAVSLTALAACAKEEAKSSGTTLGGTFSLPPESTIERDAAAEVLTGDEFILDVQTHFLDYDPATEFGSGPFLGMAFPFQNCEAGRDTGDPRVCFATESYMDEMFLKSDTSFTVLSAIPVPGDNNPLSIEVMEEAKKVSQVICQDERILLHGLAMPNLGTMESNLEAMTAIKDEHEIAAWKVYPSIPNPSAFFFDDHDPSAPQVGQAFIEGVAEIGPPIICTHKGLSSVGGGNAAMASPVDIGPAAARNPDVSFVIYHSGFEIGGVEGPYDDATRDQGVNRLISSCIDAGLEPGANVYAELGSTWWFVMRDPTVAAHVLGKLLKHMGEDNVVWGTDSIWYGTPQDQIQAFRSFEISEEFQETYGYPALTDEIKRKVFGINSAKLYGVEPEHVPCQFSREELEAARASFTVPRTYGPETRAEVAAIVAAHAGYA